MRVLLDTQLLMWAADAPELLPRKARDILETRSIKLFFSLVSIWEVSIKFGLGRPDFTMPPQELLRALRSESLDELAIADRHVIRVSTLPLLHRDPFDRLLVAQAQVEGLTLMTTDRTLTRYGSFVKRY